MSKPENYRTARDGKVTGYVGPIAVSLFQAIVIKNGIKLYADTGLKPNRAYTPSAMLRTAGAITGKTFKRGQYQQAIDALQEWIDPQRAKVPIVHEDVGPTP